MLEGQPEPRVEACRQPQQRRRQRPRRHPVAARPVLRGQDRGHLAEPQVLARDDVPVPGRTRRFHRQPVRHGHVPHVGHREAEPRHRRDLAPQQHLNQLDRRPPGRAQQRAEHQRRVDGDQLEPGRAGELPGGALGEELAPRVGRGPVRVGPVGLGAQPHAGPAVAAGDRVGGRGQHDPPHGAARRRGAEHPQGPVHRRADQLVLVGRRARRVRRGHMPHVVAALDRLRPAVVGVQAGLGQLQRATRPPTGPLLHRPQVGHVRGGQPPHAAPYRIPGTEQLGDAVPGEKAGRPGDQNPFAHHTRTHPPTHPIYTLLRM